MFANEWPGRKREREDEDDYNASGFSEHRLKRRIASLPHRQSPNLNRRPSPPFESDVPSLPAPPTITPADSDSEDSPGNVKSAFSPWSSSPTRVPQSSQNTHFASGIDSSVLRSAQIAETPFYSDDFEMTDSANLAPGAFQSDPSTTICSRIPTPICSAFSPYVRSEKAVTRLHTQLEDDEALIDRFRRGRRLPSPISEGETSPSVILEGLGDMQMEVETLSQHELTKESPMKKGHTRSKHSLRNWTGFGGELGGNGSGMRRSFSIGYRADCDKCRMKVPGHFSHIITY